MMALMVQPILAGVEINVQGNAEAKLYLDGEFVGQSPMSIRNVSPGFHQLKAENVATGEVRIYDFYSPARAMIVKDLALTVAGEGAYPPPPAVAGDAEAQAAASAAAEREAYEAGKRARAEREKVRTRNVLLGAAVANELFNRGSSKKTVRGVSLGGALLNELFRR